jgi:DNA polymerase-3 subunit gamma/tau
VRAARAGGAALGPASCAARYALPERPGGRRAGAPRFGLAARPPPRPHPSASGGCPGAARCGAPRAEAAPAGARRPPAARRGLIRRGGQLGRGTAPGGPPGGSQGLSRGRG